MVHMSVNGYDRGAFQRLLKETGGTYDGMFGALPDGPWTSYGMFPISHSLMLRKNGFSIETRRDG